MIIELSMKAVSRRDLLRLAGGAAVALIAATTLGGTAEADTAKAMMGLDKMSGMKSAGAKRGRIKLELPQIAENGNTVPLTFEVESPMTAGDYVKKLHIVADGNPNPEVASFQFTPRSGKARVSTRMRMAKTQNVIALAEMSDGSLYLAKQEVKVTIGGCGG